MLLVCIWGQNSLQDGMSICIMRLSHFNVGATSQVIGGNLFVLQTFCLLLQTERPRRDFAGIYWKRPERAGNYSIQFLIMRNLPCTRVHLTFRETAPMRIVLYSHQFSFSSCRAWLRYGECFGASISCTKCEIRDTGTNRNKPLYQILFITQNPNVPENLQTNA